MLWPSYWLSKASRASWVDVVRTLLLVIWLLFAFFSLLACGEKNKGAQPRVAARKGKLLALTIENTSGRTPFPEKVPCDVQGVFAVQHVNAWGSWTSYRLDLLAADVAVDVSQSVTLFVPLPEHLSVVSFPQQPGGGFHHTRARAYDYPKGSITIEVP